MLLHLNSNNSLEMVNEQFDDSFRNESQLSFNHLIVEPLVDDKVILIDSFRDNVCVTTTKTYDRLIQNPKHLESGYQKYFAKYFSRTNNWLEEQKLSYSTEIFENKKNFTNYIICPTYDCNMRCTYCYQQHSKTLDRNPITDQNLQRIFDYIQNNLREKEQLDSDHHGIVELFGGEPFQKSNYNLVNNVLKFARDNHCAVAATSNGMDLHLFWKLFIQYRGYIKLIGVTLDGGPSIHNRRRLSVERKDSYTLIVENINILLKIGINVIISINVDNQNFDSLEEFFDIAKKNGWSNNDKVKLEIGRVDDRFMESKYKKMNSEAELIKKLIELNNKYPFPKNIKFAFLKSSEKLAKKLGFAFNQNEAGRSDFHYCWNTSPIDDIQYIDHQLDVFRCTYTVGKKEFKIGNLDSLEKIEEVKNDIFKHSYFNIDKCQNCSIGGYCSGGCYVSRQVNFEQSCSKEKENFKFLMKYVVAPIMQERFVSWTKS
jgi:uncharacterized protein